ncbi:hypothetical protein YYG_05146 [Plasmodium vinckei petteri]|uniref:Fam-a protein n=1 Tax=Plasmodium vinckei petteri TaxID=138298 RepID=W7A8V0_PLAVN|nr:hypothetical protein YYG_05146 [Plasmodium vinckei petteri]
MKMKVILLGLISSIIFSIVLAENGSGSGSTTGCFGFCRKKPKKAHKTTTAEPVKVKGKGTYDPDIPNIKFIDEFDPIILEAPKGRQSMLAEPFISETDGTTIDKVTGFLRRENDPMRQGWYIRPYEEDYEHMIKVNFIPYREYYERKQQNAHKQHSGPHPVPKIPEKQELPKKNEMPVKQKLSTLNEEVSSKLHEDPKFDEEISITIREDPEFDEEIASFLKGEESGNEEVYQKNKHLLCTNPEETIKASEFMNETVKHLEHYATSLDGYKLCITYPDSHIDLYKKKHENHKDIERIYFNIYGSDKYNQVINKLWDPDHDNLFNKGSVKISRVYNPNLVMIQQRYKKRIMARQKYFYALATKVEISEDTTIIAYASADINDHNPSSKEYKNPIVESANLFKAEIDSEDDIRKGKLEKMFVHLDGYYIQKRRNYVNITYIESIDGHSSIHQQFIIGKVFNYYYVRT